MSAGCNPLNGNEVHGELRAQIGDMVDFMAISLNLNVEFTISKLTHYADVLHGQYQGTGAIRNCYRRRM
jgi:hypothetical protein